MRVLALIGLALSWLGMGYAASLSPFVFVMIDAKTEAEYGTLPFNRALIAKTIDKLASAKAKAIVLKFFYDLPSKEEDDMALESSICGTPVFLQACLNDEEGTTNAVPPRFVIEEKFPLDLPEIFSGDKGWTPLPRFSRCAAGLGFVDSTSTELPMLELYQGKIVKSLFLVAFELASGEKAVIEPSGKILLGAKSLPLIHRIDFQSTNSQPYIPLHEVLGGASKGWREKVNGAVVIVGYDGKNIHSIETPAGPLTAHRFFINGLMSLKTSFEQATVSK